MVLVIKGLELLLELLLLELLLLELLLLELLVGFLVDPAEWLRRGPALIVVD